MALLLPVEVLLFWHHIISCHYCPRVGRGGNASWGLGLWKLHKYTFEIQSCGVEQKLACLWHNVKCFTSAPTCVAFTCLTPDRFPVTLCPLGSQNSHFFILKNSSSSLFLPMFGHFLATSIIFPFLFFNYTMGCPSWGLKASVYSCPHPPLAHHQPHTCVPSAIANFHPFTAFVCNTPPASLKHPCFLDVTTIIILN